MAANPVIKPGTSACYDVDNTDYADSPLFYIQEGFATIEFDPDSLTTGTATGEGVVRECAWALADPNSCEIVAVDVDDDGARDNGVFDGDPGVSGGSQRRWLFDVGPGTYYIDMTAQPGAGEEGRWEVRGQQ